MSWLRVSLTSTHSTIFDASLIYALIYFTKRTDKYFLVIMNEHEVIYFVHLHAKVKTKEKSKKKENKRTISSAHTHMCFNFSIYLYR